MWCVKMLLSLIRSLKPLFSASLFDNHHTSVRCKRS